MTNKLILAFSFVNFGLLSAMLHIKICLPFGDIVQSICTVPLINN